MLVVFYNWWAPGVISFLSAYHRAILDFTEIDANLRYGLIEANEENMESKLCGLKLLIYCHFLFVLYLLLVFTPPPPLPVRSATGGYAFTLCACSHG